MIEVILDFLEARIFNFHPYLDKVPILMSQIFQTGCSTTMQLMDASCQWKMKVDRDAGILGGVSSRKLYTPWN